jgi:tetratricopeptide (TPR) repeat protein
MKRVLVTFVLALTTAAWGQGSTPAQQPPATQPPAGQPAAGQQPAAGGDQASVPTSQKVIKDPAEYNAYITALNTTDPAAKGAAMEAFVAQYPNSIVKIDALEQAMGAYQQANNQQKVEQIARQILTIEPNNVRALAIVVYIERGQIKDAASGAKARGDAERGLQELPNWKKPEGVNDADYEKMKNQMTGIFAGTAAFGALQQKDYPGAQKFYEQALKVDPNDLGNNYQMAISLLESNPTNPLGFWYGAKALSIAQAQSNQAAANGMSPYLTSRYKKYHGSTDDWNQRVTAAATQTAPPANFVASIPLAKTPCDLAADAVQQNPPDTLSFSDYELVLSCRDKSPANKDAAEKIWTFIQTKEKNGEAKLKIPVKVIAAPDTSTLDVALGEDNQAANKADMRVTMEKPLTKTPAVGSTIDVIGVISAYTPDPFMFTMTKGELPAAKAPTKAGTKKGVTKKGVKKKAS